MTMMMTNATYEEVVNALRAAAMEMKLETASVDTYSGVVKLRKGINRWTFGDIVQVNLFAIHSAQVVHVEAGVNSHGDPGLPSPYGYHRRLERELVERMRDRIGVRRCKIIP